MFKNNVGTIDRAIRVFLGVALLSMLFLMPDSAWKWLGLVGLVPLVTGAVGTCPIYSMLGISTCPSRTH